jgi:protein tyrosine/serine phosphatase
MERRTGFLGPWIRELTGLTLSDAALRQAVSVHEAFLDQAFSTIDANHGSVDRYLEDVLGVDAELRGQIEARILR